MLRFVHLTKDFGATRALDDVSFSCAPGTVMGVCGENGAGKSTLMNVLAGVIPHGSYEGEVLLGDERLQFDSPRAAAAAGVAMLPQELVYFPDRSVIDNVTAYRLPTRSGIIDRRQQRHIASEELERVGLVVDLDRPLRDLDAGARQLTCIARALATKPRVLLLDEPTAALQRQEAENLLRVVDSLRATGVITLFISHHLEEVARIADQVVVLRDGQLVLEPTTGVSQKEIVRAMVGAELVEDSTARSPRVPSGSDRLQVDLHEVAHGDHVLLERVAFAVEAGEVFGLAGLTGSGAAEVLRVVAGAANARVKGTVRVNGEELDLSTPAATRRYGVTLVPEDRRTEGLVLMHSVAANALLGREDLNARGGMRLPQRELRASSQLTREFEVQPADPHRDVFTLSGGNQQKVVLSRTAVGDCRVALLIEPTRGVDVGARRAIHDRIRRMARSGTAVIVTGSDHAELLALCDRVGVMRHRGLSRIYPRNELDEERLVEAINRDDPRHKDRVPPTGPKGPNATDRTER